MRSVKVRKGFKIDAEFACGEGEQKERSKSTKGIEAGWSLSTCLEQRIEQFN